MHCLFIRVSATLDLRASNPSTSNKLIQDGPRGGGRMHIVDQRTGAWKNDAVNSSPQACALTTFPAEFEPCMLLAKACKKSPRFAVPPDPPKLLTKF